MKKFDIPEFSAKAKVQYILNKEEVLDAIVAYLKSKGEAVPKTYPLELRTSKGAAYPSIEVTDVRIVFEKD
jgi:hypothetical protein